MITGATDWSSGTGEGSGTGIGTGPTGGFSKSG